MDPRDWQAFVLEHGRGVRSSLLAAAVKQPAAAIDRLRQHAGCTPRSGPPPAFVDLFARWHGRPPRDDEWPAPRKIGHGYEWLGPELALLARMVGQHDKPTIAQALTARLQRVTGDLNARRGPNHVQIRVGLLGLQMSDVVGGLTVSEAARQIGISSILYNDIRNGKIQTTRVGRFVVIPHDEFARWKAARVFPPAGFVSLSRLKRPLGIRSDKLSEYARAGRIPTAIRCNPYGARAHSTQFGTWYIDQKVFRKVIADRRAGRPMPWFGTADSSNIKVTWALWQQRKHPTRCRSCQVIWGPVGAPTTLEDYLIRYPPLPHGAKRHLTRPYSDGLTLAEVAKYAGVTTQTVQTALRIGTLRGTRVSGRLYITRTDATRWKARNCPTGEAPMSWLSIAWACKIYGFRKRELTRYIRRGRLRVKVGINGPMRGVRYVLKQQVRELREELGFKIADVAARCHISEARVRTMAKALDWRATDRLTLDVVRGIEKRLESEEGYTIREAARALGKSIAWIEHEIVKGTARVRRTPFKTDRRYLSKPMFARLQAAARHPTKLERWSSEWLLVSDAAVLAGVCTTQLIRWSNEGQIKFKVKGRFRRYHRRSVMTRARQYWANEVRFKRKRPPAWLLQEAA